MPLGKSTVLQPLGANERKLLGIIRTNGMMPRHKITPQMDVSAQAVGQIVRRLDEYSLLMHHKAVKVGLGQPPKPMSLNPDGAFSIGIKIGRRRTDLLLVDLLGLVRERHTLHYAFPVAQDVIPQLALHLTRIQAQLLANDQPLVGIGVAAPFALGGWHRRLGLSQAQADEWQRLDLKAAIEAMTTRPVRFAKDTAAACIAELLDGKGRTCKNFLYIFVDTFVGGGVVSGGRWLETAHGNAGAVASVPMGNAQLLDHASLWELEQRYARSGLDPAAAYDSRALDSEHAPQTQAWLAQASTSLAASIVAGTAFLDTDAVVIGGSLCEALRAQLIDSTERALDAFNWEGLWRPNLLAGVIGEDAGALGGAFMPLHEYFFA